MDFLWDDHRALAACSLTCSSWLHTTRLHMFETIQFSSNLAQAFRKYLTSFHNVAPYVRRLVLQRFHTVQFPRMAWYAQNLKFPYFPMVKTLEISGGYTEDLATFLFAFPQLSSLRLGRIAWTKGVEGPELHPVIPSSDEFIQELALDGMDDSVLRWLTSGAVRFRLRILSITLSPSVNDDSVRQLLQAAGRLLEEMRVTFQHDSSRRANSGDMGLWGLIFNTGIRKFTASMEVRAGDDARDYVAWVPHALASLRSLQLREIRLEMRVHPQVASSVQMSGSSIRTVMRCVDKVDWTHVDKTIEKIGRTVKKVAVVVSLEVFDDVLHYSSADETWRTQLGAAIAARLGSTLRRTNIVLGVTVDFVKERGKRTPRRDSPKPIIKPRWFALGLPVEESAVKERFKRMLERSC